MRYLATLLAGVALVVLGACASVRGRTQLTSTDVEIYRAIVNAVDADKKTLVFVVSRRLMADKRAACGPESDSRFWQNRQPAPDSRTIESYCNLPQGRLSAAQARQIGARWPARAILVAQPTTRGVVLSPIAYGPQQTEALVYVAHDYVGELWLLRADKSGWSVAGTYHLWIA